MNSASGRVTRFPFSCMTYMSVAAASYSSWRFADVWRCTQFHLGSQRHIDLTAWDVGLDWEARPVLPLTFFCWPMLPLGTNFTGRCGPYDNSKVYLYPLIVLALSKSARKIGQKVGFNCSGPRWIHIQIRFHYREFLLFYGYRFFVFCAN